jgi:GT2 family glycosyltransferase
MESAGQLQALIAIVTSNRPKQVVEVLESIKALEVSDLKWLAVVIDNPPNEETRKAVESASGSAPVEYVAEDVGSITRARNRGLREAIDRGAEALVFIDDDETADVDWLDVIWTAHLNSPKTVVFGPVRTILPPGTPEAIVRSGIADNHNPVYEDGSLQPTCASNNTLIPVGALGEIWFDSRFDRSGGGDTDFFRRLNRTGVEIRYCSAARVSEPWSSDRANSRFLMERARRVGWLNAMVLLHHDGAWALPRVAASVAKNLAEAAGLMVLGLLRRDTALGLRARERWFRALGKTSRIVGRPQPTKPDW